MDQLNVINILYESPMFSLNKVEAKRREGEKERERDGRGAELGFISFSIFVA